jgi:hypothetical protein
MDEVDCDEPEIGHEAWPVPVRAVRFTIAIGSDR